MTDSVNREESREHMICCDQRD